MKWSQAFFSYNSPKNHLILVFQGLAIAMTMSFAFIHGVFEPLEQWGMKIPLQFGNSMGTQSRVFPVLHGDPATDHWVILKPIPNHSQTSLVKPRPPHSPLVPRWSEVLANTYTNDEKKTAFTQKAHFNLDFQATVEAMQTRAISGSPCVRISASLTLVLIVFGSYGGLWLSRRLGIGVALSIVSALGLTYVSLTYAILSHANVWLNLVPFPLTLMLGCGVVALQERLTHKSNSSPCADAVTSPSFSSTLSPNAPTRPVSPQRRIVTVLFVDIRGFSSVAERMSPEDVFALLSHYQREVTEAIVRHGGTIDKYMGDAVMALFNAPRPQTNHASRAVSSAIECARRIRHLASQFQKRFGQTVSCGIGIHTGEALVGSMGSTQRVDYTAIGDTVNLAANLEELSKTYRVPIVMSEATHREIPSHFYSRLLDEIRVKGRERFMRIHTVLEQDERCGHRVPVTGRAVVHQVGTSSWGDIVDVSARGMSLKHLDYPIEEGRLFDLHLQSSGNRLALSVQAKVVWTHAHRAGFEFVKFSQKVKPDAAQVIKQDSHEWCL